MKIPKKPRAPKKILTITTDPKKIDLQPDHLYSFDSFRDMIVKQCPKVELKDIRFSISGFNTSIWGRAKTDAEIQITSKKVARNENYDSQYDSYLKELEQYNNDMKKYKMSELASKKRKDDAIISKLEKELSKLKDGK